MPRDGSGVYTLPVGNPVVTNTVIASAWANTTMSDIAAQLNNVLTRDGLLGPTGPFKIVDGTVNAPGLAWNSEPGLGWYRYAAGIISVAQGGLQVAQIASGAAQTYQWLFPKQVDGTSGLRLATAQPGVSNINLLDIIQNADGSSRISNTGTGTKTQGNLFFSALNFVFESNTTFGSCTVMLNKTAGSVAAGIVGRKTNVVRWGLYLGQESDFFSIARYNASGTWVEDSFAINPTTGNITFSPGGAQYTLAGASLYVPSNAGVSAWNSSISVPMVGASWGSWNGADGRPVLQTTADPGDKALWLHRHVVNGVGYPVAFGCYGQTTPFTSAFYRFYVNSYTYDLDGLGNPIKNVAGPWIAPSDGRLKKNVVDFKYGLDEILKLNPIWYDLIDDGLSDGFRKVSLIAQDAMQVIPEMVGTLDNSSQRYSKQELDQVYSFNPNALTYALINAIKTLNQRLAQLENA